MFTSLVRNIVISGIAYSVISLVGLVLAPFLIATYGLAGYGQILLARLFQPSANFAFLDLGIADAATRTVAAARHDGRWEEAASAVTLLALMALAVSALFAAFMVATAWAMPGWMGIAPDQQAGFTRVMLLTAALQPALFLSLVFEGTLKGFEHFRGLRSCEVVSALIYGGLALAFGLSGWGPNWVAVGLLIGLSVRFLMVATFALASLRAAGVRATRWSRETRTSVFRWSRLMLANRILGAFQTQIASPLIGLLLGPAAVGAFDAAVRLPRFVKSILSLLSTTVLPVSAGLKARADKGALRRLGNYGILAAVTISAPPALFAMAYSRSLMEYWIGDVAIDFWGWQSAMFVPALLNVVLSFGGGILLADVVASTRLNRLAMWQVGLQLVLSLALLPWFAQWTFVIGQVASVAIVFPFQFAAIRQSLDLGDRLLRQFLLLIAFTGLAALGLRLLVPAPSLPALIALAAGFVPATWAILLWLLLGRDERGALLARLKTRAARPAPAGAGLRDGAEGLPDDRGLADGRSSK
jgi:O-antigen/teichoic acid export membrane protein